MWFVIGFILFLLLGIRWIAPAQRALVLMFGKSTNRVVGPGIVWIYPLIGSLRRVSIEPFIVSLPPQSAITKDEIPIQLQASLHAQVRNPSLAVAKVREWRIYLVSQLQDLMKERLEELEFDSLDSVFAKWKEEIGASLQQKADEIGVAILSLQISNLSPRTKPAL